jgi:uncharacterized beta-barrel protein YwiB (DUF1934 family)
MDQLSFVYGIFRKVRSIMEARIRVYSEVKNETSVNRSRVDTTGLFTERNGSFYARYDEPEGSDLAGSATTIKWGAGTVTILRTRPYELREEFEQGRTFETTYHTPYMDIPLRIRTRRLAVFRKGRGWEIRLRYDSELGGEASRIAVTVDVEPLQRQVPVEEEPRKLV